MLLARRSAAITCAAFGLLVPVVEGQRAQDPPTFRTSTALATVDAVVVDAEGQPVINLTAADFDIEQGGKRQVLRQAVYVPLGASADQLRQAGMIVAAPTAGAQPQRLPCQPRPGAWAAKLPSPAPVMPPESWQWWSTTSASRSRAPRRSAGR